MSATAITKPPVDLLTEVIGNLRPELSRDRPVKERLATTWSFIVEAHDLAASDVVVDDFMSVVIDSGLLDDLGRHGREDLDHVIAWGLRGLNPFERGPLK